VKVLVITHDATLSGAPRVALLITRLLAGSGHDVQVVSRTPGPMLAQFSAEAPTAVEPAHRWRARLWRRAPRPLALAVDATMTTLTLLRARPDLVYVNSTSAALYARAARWTRRRAIVLHGHESGVNSDVFLRRAGLRRPDEGIALVACSPSVQGELAALLDLPPTDIALLPSVPDQDVVLERAEAPAEPAYGDGLVIGCCGTAEMRKGVDLWETAAAKVRGALPGQDLRFVWVGAADDVRSETIDFVGPVDNPYPHLRRFDLLVLPSRDDPFPLVVLESMLLGTPVVAFDVGAVREQVGDAGVIVPAEDTTALADAVIRLVVDEDGRRQLGAAARERATTRFSTAAFARGLADVVGDVTPAGPPAS
jgi:glycosyltransferase involved in cell wall biosynthesis